MSLAARSLALAQAIGADVKTLTAALGAAEQLATNTTLTSGNSGKTYSLAAGCTATLPAASDGLRYTLLAVSVPAHMAVPAGVTLVREDGASSVAPTLTLPVGTSIEVICLAGSWFILNYSSTVSSGASESFHPFMLMGA